MEIGLIYLKQLCETSFFTKFYIPGSLFKQKQIPDLHKQQI
jgi:hypothetical protein